MPTEAAPARPGHWLVTGCSSGIGRHIALAALAKGHRVAVTARDPDAVCDIAERYLQKGSKVYLEGELQTRKWQDQSGQDRYTTEVVLRRFRGVLTMLDSRGGGGGGGGDFGGGGDNFPQDQGMPAGPGDDLDDEIPF